MNHKPNRLAAVCEAQHSINRTTTSHHTTPHHTIPHHRTPHHTTPQNINPSPAVPADPGMLSRPTPCRCVRSWLPWVFPYQLSILARSTRYDYLFCNITYRPDVIGTPPTLLGLGSTSAIRACSPHRYPRRGNYRDRPCLAPALKHSLAQHQLCCPLHMGNCTWARLHH